MLTLIDVYTLALAHFMGDFVLQSDAMSKGKSKSNWVLSVHVVAYGVFVGLISANLFTSIGSFLGWVAGNMVLHFITDYVTSRRTSRLWAEGRVHDFFVTIGFDQMLHMLCLFTLLVLIR